MKTVNIPPIALTATLTTNLLNCAVSSLSGPVGFTLSQPYLLVTHWRIVNKDSAPHVCSFWKGATAANAAGTEIWAQGTQVPANSFIEGFGETRFDSADFLVGGGNTNLTLQIEAEIGIS
jgi:hypothetical protein